MIKFLKRLFSSPEIETKVVTVPKFEFVTNPPAKELAEKNALLREERKQKELAEYKILQKIKLANDVDQFEMSLNSAIKSAIENGRFYHYISMTHEMHKRITKSQIKCYLAARRFRARGFKVELSLKELKQPPHYMFEPKDGTKLEMITYYGRSITISWE